MKAFKTFTRKVIPLAVENVDTDMIIPAQYLTQINRDGYGKFIFQRLKEQNSEFVFNKKEYHDANILLTLSNFGCGSSREHAVWALQQAGINTIIGESFSDIFFSNAVKNGLLLITLRAETINAFFTTATANMLQFTINLEEQKIISEIEIFDFDYDPFRKNCLLNGHDDMDYLLSHRKKINEYNRV